MSAQFQDNNKRRSVVVQAECDSIREFVPSALISNAVSPVDNSVAIIGGKKRVVWEETGTCLKFLARYRLEMRIQLLKERSTAAVTK